MSYLMLKCDGLLFLINDIIFHFVWSNSCPMHRFDVLSKSDKSYIFRRPNPKQGIPNATCQRMNYQYFGRNI